MTSGNGNSNPSDLIALGLKMLGEAVKTYGREMQDEVQAEGNQIKDLWSQVTDKLKTPTASASEPAPSRQREDLAFGLATRAVTALEDIALNTAAIRQVLARQQSAPRGDGGPDDTARFGE